MNISVTQLYRYPVKSMGGHSLDEAHLGPNGIPGDRCWTLKDEERGGIKGGKRFPQLMGMQATLVDEPSAAIQSPEAIITLADGTRLSTNEDYTAEAISAAVGAPVSLWPLLPADQLEHYLRQPFNADNPDLDPETALRGIFARTEDEPLPDLSIFPAELMTYESIPGTYFDAFPLLIMSTSALAAMQDFAEHCDFDVRRFRPNIMVECEEKGFPENAWAGKKAQLGSATIQLEMACPRCVMTTHGFDTVAKDPKVMRALVQANAGNLGIYAKILEPGNVSVGDTLRLLD